MSVIPLAGQIPAPLCGDVIIGVVGGRVSTYTLFIASVYIHMPHEVVV
jgi:exosome complex RNA-binding protein Rrp4